MLKEFYDMKEKIKTSNDKSFKVYKLMFLSKCSVCNGKKSNFFKEQGTTGLTGNLKRLNIPILSDLPLIKAFFRIIKWIQ